MSIQQNLIAGVCIAIGIASSGRESGLAEHLPDEDRRQRRMGFRRVALPAAYCPAVHSEGDGTERGRGVYQYYLSHRFLL